MQGRPVLVTGAGSGIGLVTALHLAARGFAVTGTVRSDLQAAEVGRTATAAGVRVATVELDVTDEEGCRRVVADVGPYGLVNNAGFANLGALEDQPVAWGRAQLEAMVVAPVHLALLALPAMRARGEGRIVNISSVSAHTGFPLTGWYQASKHALGALSDALRVETAGAGVRVVQVEPGMVDTPIWDRALAELEVSAGGRYAGAARRARRLIRLTRPLMAGPDRVARVVVRALTAPRPRPRYLVGLDAPVLLAAGAAPRRVQDAALRALLGL